MSLGFRGPRRIPVSAPAEPGSLAANTPLPARTRTPSPEPPPLLQLLVSAEPHAARGPVSSAPGSQHSDASTLHEAPPRFSPAARPPAPGSGIPFRPGPGPSGCRSPAPPPGPPPAPRLTVLSSTWPWEERARDQQEREGQGAGERRARHPPEPESAQRMGRGRGRGRGREGREGGGGRAREGVSERGSGAPAPSFPVLLLPPQRPSLARPPLAAVGGPGAPAARLARRGSRPKSPPLRRLIGLAQGSSHAEGASGHVMGRGGDSTRPPALPRGRPSESTAEYSFPLGGILVPVNERKH